MSWTRVQLLRPVLFALEIVVAVVAGAKSGSFWIGLLAFFVAAGLARALRRGLLGRRNAALRALVWPLCATGFAVLYVELGLPDWAAAFLAVLCATLVQIAVLVLPLRRWEPPSNAVGVIEGRATRVDP